MTRRTKRTHGTNGFDVSRRPQNRPLRDRKSLRRPRSTDLRTQIAFDKNNLKSPDTLAKYRAGYVKAFKVPAARERLLKLGFKEPGTYAWGQQGDTMFSLPHHIPVAFTDEEAGWIARECYLSKSPKLTKSNMEGVRAMLSYAYQLKTGIVATNKNKANFPSVTDQFGCQTLDGYAKPTRSNKVKHSVEPEGLKTAFTTEWNPETSMPFPAWVVGGRIAWSWSVAGCRGGKKGGLMRLQKSRQHEIICSAGIMATSMLGGRPKVPGINRERQWKVFAVCLCPGGRHKQVPRNWLDNLDEKSNPVDVNWCTVCPLNMWQCTQDLLPASEKGRTFPRWLPAQNRYGDKDLGKDALIKMAQAWLDEQGANPDNLKFCTNSGRKALGKWCGHLRIPYLVSVEVHGDLWSTWSKYYQRNLRKEYTEEREQSTNVDDATECLWRFATFIGRGRPRDDLTDISVVQLGQMSAEILKKLAMQDTLTSIMNGTYGR